MQILLRIELYDEEGKTLDQGWVRVESALNVDDAASQVMARIEGKYAIEEFKEGFADDDK